MEKKTLPAKIEKKIDITESMHETKKKPLHNALLKIFVQKNFICTSNKFTDGLLEFLGSFVTNSNIKTKINTQHTIKIIIINKFKIKIKMLLLIRVISYNNKIPKIGNIRI